MEKGLIKVLIEKETNLRAGDRGCRGASWVDFDLLRFESERSP